jgi:hypothetical protein
LFVGSVGSGSVGRGVGGSFVGLGCGVGDGAALGAGVGSGVALGASVGEGVVTTRIVALGDCDGDADADGDGETVDAPPKRGAPPKSAPTTTIVARLPAIAASTRST